MMLRSLTAQVLQQYPFIPSRVWGFVAVGNAINGDLREMRKLFECLIQNLPPNTTIACVIDGIQFYENVDEVLDFLTVFVGFYTRIKLLLTTRIVTCRVRSLFQKLAQPILTIGSPFTERARGGSATAGTTTDRVN